MLNTFLVTSKLTNLCTVTTEGHGSDVTANFNPEESIQAFIDVLKCPHMEASFYLESSDWNIETAVLLWLENNPNPINLRSYSKEYSSSAYNPHVVGDSNSSSNNRHLNLGDFSHSDNIFAYRRFGGYADEDDEYEFKRTAGQVNADGLMYPQRRRSAWIRTSGISRRWRPRTVVRTKIMCKVSSSDLPLSVRKSQGWTQSGLRESVVQQVGISLSTHLCLCNQ